MPDVSWVNELKERLSLQKFLGISSDSGEPEEKMENGEDSDESYQSSPWRKWRSPLWTDLATLFRLRRSWSKIGRISPQKQEDAGFLMVGFNSLTLPLIFTH